MTETATTLNIESTGKQREALWLLGMDETHEPPDKKPVNLLLLSGGCASGKTTALFLIAALRALEWPGSSFGMCYRSAHEAFYPQGRFGDLFIPSGEVQCRIHTPHGAAVVEWKNGSTTHFLGLSEPERLRSYEFTGGAAIDGSVYVKPATIELLYERLRPGFPVHKGWHPQLTLATVPDPGDPPLRMTPGYQWHLDTFITGHEPGVPWTVEHMRLAWLGSKASDNPYLTREAVDQLRDLTAPFLRKALPDGEWKNP